MKSLWLSAMLLSGCVSATLETSANDHQEFALVAAPSVRATVQASFEARLSGKIADALRKAETPSNKYVDSVTLDGAVSALQLSTNTTLAGIQRCQIALKAGSSTVTLSDHALTAQERDRVSVSLPLQNATLEDVRPLLEQSNPTLQLTLEVIPAEVTASKVFTDLALDVAADIAASL
jgi:PBP1b-binding outer membrane lipoprotein LpoB